MSNLGDDVIDASKSFERKRILSMNVNDGSLSVSEEDSEECHIDYFDQYDACADYPNQIRVYSIIAKSYKSCNML